MQINRHDMRCAVDSTICVVGVADCNRHCPYTAIMMTSHIGNSPKAGANIWSASMLKFCVFVRSFLTQNGNQRVVASLAFLSPATIIFDSLISADSLSLRAPHPIIHMD